MLDCHEPGNLSFITKLYSVTLGLEATVLKHGPEQKRHSLCYLRGSIEFTAKRMKVTPQESLSLI